MKFLVQIAGCLFLLISCGHAQAQFSQPPPNRPPPVCTVVNGAKSYVISQKASGGVVCASDDFRTLLQCQLPQRSSVIVSCIATTQWFNGLQWVAVNPATLIHDWAFIIDWQEYYLASGESGVPGVIAWGMPGRYDRVYFDCGYSGVGYVRVSAAGKTAQVPFYCDPWGND
jgi:hypothetical protein